MEMSQFSKNSGIRCMEQYHPYSKGIFMAGYYSEEETILIKKLHPKLWSGHEIAYQLHLLFGTKRTPQGIKGLKQKLIAKGELAHIGKGRRYVTREALQWCNKTYNLSAEPASCLQVVEGGPKKLGRPLGSKNGHTNGRNNVRTNGNGNGHSNGHSKGLSAEAIQQIAREPAFIKGSYTTKLLSLAASKPEQLIKKADFLGLYRSLLESAVDESRTAIDMLEDLKAADI